MEPEVAPMTRPGLGTKGRPVDLVCNHFQVQYQNKDEVNQYDVTIAAEDEMDTRVISKVMTRKVMAKLRQAHGPTDLMNKKFAYDGEKTLFTVGRLPFQSQDFKISLDEDVGSRRPISGEDAAKKRRASNGRDFKVKITFAVKVDMQSLENLAKKKQGLVSQDAIRVLDILLREHAAKREYILVRENFYHLSFGPPGDLGESVISWRGFHASFRPTQTGLSLNMDPSSTTLLKDQYIPDFFGEYLRKDPRSINPDDLVRAKKILKGVQVENVLTKTKHKIFGFSNDSAAKQTFSWKSRESDGSFGAPKEVTVADYYGQKHNRQLTLAHIPCLDVGRKNKPTYIPIELCKIVPGQRYIKKLSGNQVRKHLDQARQKPEEKRRAIQEAMAKHINYNADELVRDFHVSFDNNMLKVRGRILEPPMLKFGGSQEETPRNGRWNYNNKTMARSIPIKNWIVLSFGRTREQEASGIAQQLAQCCNKKGMNINPPQLILAEDQRTQGRPAGDRVSMMFNTLKSQLKGPPEFILCILPQKDSDLYGPFKKLFLSDIGVVNQCIVPPRNINDQYLTNVALKINAKCGGYNTVLSMEFGRGLPKVSREPTIIFGMDVSHGAPFSSNSPSIAAVVGSRDWPRISQFAARVKTQSPKVETINALYEEASGGMIAELLKGFADSVSIGTKQLPPQLVVFRDGVSESQFGSVLNVELAAIRKACQGLKDDYNPKITLIVAQKRHHTRFFPADGQGNIPPGTIVDTVVCDPQNYDFFLSSHAGLIGTTRPTHYIVLMDEIGFNVDELQHLINYLSYTYAKSTTAVSVVTPIMYAHLAATKARSFLDDDSLSESASSLGGGSSGGTPQPNLPQIKLHDKMLTRMFFV